MTSAVFTQHKILELAITDDQRERALARDDAVRADLARRGLEHLYNSITKGKRNFIGMLGEEIIYDLYLGLTRPVIGAHYDWDFVLKQVRRGTIDVKTKLQKYNNPPGPHYNATVCDKNINQVCDWYCFVRVHIDCEKAWVLGFMPKTLFFDRARKYFKGEPDPTSHDNWPFKEDCWNLATSRLLTAPENIAGLVELFSEYDAHENS